MFLIFFQVIHTLTARAMIRDWENGVLDPDHVKHEIDKKNNKKRIIELSKDYSIVTQFTSFVAVEEREKVSLNSSCRRWRHGSGIPWIWFG